MLGWAVLLQIKEDTWFNDHTGIRRIKVTQYHDVIGATTGRRWLAEFSKAVTIIELVGLCVAQVIASSSNLYSLHSALPKRYADANGTWPASSASSTGLNAPLLPPPFADSQVLYSIPAWAGI